MAQRVYTQIECQNKINELCTGLVTLTFIGQRDSSKLQSVTCPHHNITC